MQSALLEVMQAHQVTIGGTTHPVPEPFLVMATQNPIESEGTYPLPEAQVDRFMLKVVVDYPGLADELTVVERSPAEAVVVRLDGGLLALLFPSRCSATSCCSGGASATPPASRTSTCWQTPSSDRLAAPPPASAGAPGPRAAS